MRNIVLLALTLLCCLPSLAAGSVRAYGVRAFTAAQHDAGPALVSWDAAHPEVLTTIDQFDKSLYFRAGAAHNGTYYLINSGYDGGDGIVAYSFYTYDVAARELHQVAAYETLRDAESSLIVSDMAYNPADNKLYLWAFNLAGGQVNGDDIDAPYGLYTLDTTTGRATLVGYEEVCQWAAFAISAQGRMVGVDLEGNLREIDPLTAQPGQTLIGLGINPYGLQSMAFNATDGLLYWAGFETFDAQSGRGFFARIDLSGANATFAEIGDFAGMTEILGLHIDGQAPANEAPAAPANLVVTPAAEGALSATISWTNPSVALSGQALTTPLTAKLWRDSVLVAMAANQTPGQAATLTDADVPQAGLYRYTLALENEQGAGEPLAVAQTWVGEDVADSVTALTATLHGDAIDVAWTAPARGLHHGWIDQASLCYELTRVHDGKTLATALAEPRFSDSDLSALAAYAYTVTPVTRAGRGVSSTTAPVVLGAAEVPFVSDFSQDNTRQLWTVIDGDHDGCTFTHDLYSSTGEHFMKYFPNELSLDTADDWLLSPLLNLQGGKTYRVAWRGRLYGAMFPFSMDVTCGSTVVAQVRDKVSELHDLWTGQARIDVANDETAQVGFHVIQLMPCQISRVEVSEWFATDAALTALEGPRMVAAHQPAQFTATVLNNGYEPLRGCTLALLDGNGQELCAAACPEVAVGEQAQVALSFTPAQAGEMTLQAVASVEGDALAINNSATLHTTVIDDGAWQEVNPFTGYLVYAPFALKSNDSQAQSVYTAEETGGNACTVMGLKYHYMMPVKRDLDPVHITIGMANTEVQTLADGQKVDNVTTVYDGLVTIDPNGTELSITFDNPFHYNGGNLCIETTQHHDGTFSAVPWWNGSYDSARPVSSWVDDGDGYRLSAELPYVSLYTSSPLGISTLTADAPHRIYTLQGIAVNQPWQSLKKGFYVVDGKVMRR